MEISATTISAISRSWNMSARILPARAISPVVRPVICSLSRAGEMSSRSTRSKSTPLLVPNGRTMKACILGSGAAGRGTGGEAVEVLGLDFDLGDLLPDDLHLGDVVHRVHLADML